VCDYYSTFVIDMGFVLEKKGSIRYICSPSRIKFNDLRSKRNSRVLWMKGRGRGKETALIREVEIKILYYL
jgi:hypothetical protein